MKRMTEIATVAAAVLLMLTAALVYLGPPIGFRVDNVVSGSMEPVISRGTMIVAEKVDPLQVKANDIITFRPVMVGEQNICHRVIEVLNTIPRSFQTKGDALSAADPWQVPAANVLGRVVFDFPTLGFYIGFLKTTTGLVTALVVPSLIIAYFIVKALWKELVRYIRSSPPKVS